MLLAVYREKLNRLKKEKLKCEIDQRKEREKIVKINSEILRIKKGIPKKVSQLQLTRKLKQIETKQKQLHLIEKKVSDLETKITKKTDEINRTLKEIDRRANQESKKEEQMRKKRDKEQLSHLQKITREKEKQIRLEREIGKSPLVIDLAKLPTEITVLFFAANPQNLTQLRLDEEIREITNRIRLSEYRDSVKLISKWAVRPSDLMQALNEHKPHIIHFSGHGSNNDEIVFMGDDGKQKLVSKRAIVELMKAMTDNIKLVLFNTCYSSSQAEEVVEYIDAAIGMNTAIGDNAARVFAAQFYSAIGFGKSIQAAFNQAKAALLLEDIKEENTPELFVKEEFNGEELILVMP